MKENIGVGSQRPGVARATNKEKIKRHNIKDDYD